MEVLPSDLWPAIFGFVPDHLFAARCVCTAWRGLLGEEPADITPRTILETLSAGGDPAWLKAALADWGGHQANELLYQAAATGDSKGMRLAKAWGASDFDMPLAVTAEGNQLAWGAIDFDMPLAVTAEGNQLEAMALLKQWGATNFNRALAYAAGEGQLEAMELLKAWGATEFDHPLAYAAGEGQLEAMELLKAWGATEFDRALANAAYCGQLLAMKLAKKWGATNFGEALVNAIKSGQAETMELLVTDWGASGVELDWALAVAAFNGQLEAMGLLKEWGASNFNGALSDAAQGGRLEAMRLAKAWIEPSAAAGEVMRVANQALEVAAEHGQLKAMDLLREWGATG